jgi:murein DD-endopeptidase MepM/ murein hydrolase activator NlpD
MRRLLVLAATLIVCLLAGSASAADGADGEWGWPLPPPHDVVAGFDPPAQAWLAGHRGVDLAGRAGEPVRAAGAGTVAFAGMVAGVAVGWIRQSGGVLTTYQPVAAVVSAGDRVARGERIGHLVRAGSHCAPQVCLHWGLRRGDDYLDPLLLVSGGQVRLLPLYDGSPGSLPIPGAGGLAAGSLSAVLGGGGVVGWRLRCRRIGRT